MGITVLTVLVLLVGLVTYRLSKPLVGPVRVVGACVLMISLAALIVQNREIIADQGNSSGAWHFPIFSDKRAPNVPTQTHDPGPVAYATFQNISKEDHNFLDEILQKQNQDGQQQGKPAPTQTRNMGKAGIIGSGNEPVLKAELVINTAEVNNTGEVKRSEPETHKETVKRAELVRPGKQ
jgi:hypothetical protein